MSSHGPPASTVVQHGPPAPPAGGGVVRPAAPRTPGAVEWVLLALLVIGSAAVRLLWLGAPVARDEAGYLMVAAQWHPGTSLYGNYWVDRPPVLIGFFAIAHLLGGIVAERVMGGVLAGLAVLLAYALGRALGQRNGSALWPAAAAAAFVSTPLFDVVTVNGELVAVPFVLAGIVAAVRGRSASRHRTAWWLAAGALGGAAVLVKQDFADVFVFVGALALAGWAGRSVERVRLRDLAALVTGAAALTAGVLALSAWRGTSLHGLWEAVVIFRIRAGGYLRRAHDPSTLVRQEHYPELVLASGAFLVLLVLVAVLLSRRRSSLAVAAAVTVLWEITAIGVSGQFWSHYLVGLVPGLVLAVALATSGRGLVPVAGRLVVG